MKPEFEQIKRVVNKGYKELEIMLYVTMVVVSVSLVYIAIHINNL